MKRLGKDFNEDRNAIEITAGLIKEAIVSLEKAEQSVMENFYIRDSIAKDIIETLQTAEENTKLSWEELLKLI